jgi:hypothetical protein
MHHQALRSGAACADAFLEIAVVVAAEGKIIPFPF